MPSFTLAVDTNNDLYINSIGNLATAVDLESTLQACSHSAKTILGEMIFSTDAGLPKFETIWVGVPNRPQYEAALRAALLQVPGVEEVISVVWDEVATVLLYTVLIRTEYGTGSIANG